MSNEPPPDEAERQRIVRELDRSMLVEAAAGTGKTTNIIRRMVALLAEGSCGVGTMAAVTFTRKAASEIRDRFQVELEEAYRKAVADDQQSDRAQRLATALENQQRCFIGTIHSFCARLLRERPVEADVEIDFQEIDEAQDEELRIRAWRNYIDRLLATDAPIVEEMEWLDLRLGRSTTPRRRVVNELEELGLELPQLGAAFTTMAGFPDVVDWPASPRALPDLAPARQAIQEYLEHLESLDLDRVSPGNCKLIPKVNRLVLASRHLTWKPPEPLPPGAGDEQKQRHEHQTRRATANLMSLLEHFDGSDPKLVQKQWPGGKPQALDELASWVAFRDQWSLPHLKAWREHRYEKVIEVLRGALADYDQLRREMNALNFQDLLLKARDLLRREDVRHYFRRRVTHLLVDEFQDTDPLQAELMMLLTADDIGENDWRKCRPAPGALFVVGDPKQSIYRFRRADMEVYLTVYEIMEATAAIVRLSANFRSDELMLQWINETFEPVFPEEPTPQQASRRNLDYGNQARLVKDSDVVERSAVDDNLREWKAADAEAKWIATRIQQLLAENPKLGPGDLMLLTPTRKRLNVYSKTLQEAGIPHEVTGGSELNKSEELRLLRELLRVAARPDDPIALLSVLRGELFGISDDTLYAWRQNGRIGLSTEVTGDSRQDSALRDALERIRRYQKWLSRMPMAVAMERVADDVGLTAKAASEGPARAGAFGKALELLRSGATEGVASDLLARLDALVSTNEERDGASVMISTTSPMQVMNLHKAKGLQATVVFLADPSGYEPRPVRLHIDRSGGRDAPPRGYLAIYSGFRKGPEPWESQEKLLACPADWETYEAREREYLDAEQQRLLYVAATRARSKLICCPRGTHHNRWAFFGNQFPAEATPGVKDFEPRVPQAPPSLPKQKPGEIVRQRWATSLEPTYRVKALKELALRGAAAKPTGADPDGAAWGSAVHAVLEVMLKAPASDPQQVADAALQQQQLDRSRSDDLVQMLQNVQRSTVWKRATDSPQRYCEVPLTTLLPPKLQPLSDANSDEPLLVRGVIDLVFREDDHWVVVDYKSEALSPIETQLAATHYTGQLEAYAAAWEHLSQQTVGEKGILFTHDCRYIKV